MNEIDTTSSHYKGKFNNIYEVQEKYPNGGVDGDYVDIAGWAHYWEADRGTWCVNEKRDEYWDELITQISSDMKVFGDKVTQEISDRTAGDTDLDNKISDEITARSTADAALQRLIDTTRTTGYRFMGVATPETNPGTPTQNLFYIATGIGTYANFGTGLMKQVKEGDVTSSEEIKLSVEDGEVAFFIFNGYHSSSETAIPNGWKKVTLIKRHVIQEIESDDYDKLVKSGSVDENVYYTVFE